jgi:hypothetical protein
VASEVVLAGEGCRLTLRAEAYELPSATDFDDGNWLKGEVALEGGVTGSFRARHRLALRAEDLSRLRDDLGLVLGALNGVITFSHLEGQYGGTLTLENGSGNLSVFVREHVGSELRVRDCRTDQSYLSQTLRELDQMVAEFPVRGRPGEAGPAR